MDILIIVLLATGFAGELLCCIGLAASRNFYSRLHSVSASSVFAVFIGVAVVAREGFTSPAGIKACLIIATLILTGPISVHALARAAFRREERETGEEML